MLVIGLGMVACGLTMAVVVVVVARHAVEHGIDVFLNDALTLAAEVLPEKPAAFLAA